MPGTVAGRATKVDVAASNGPIGWENAPSVSGYNLYGW